MSELVEKYENRAFKTYRARLYASKRLRARGIGWNSALISISTATSISAIAEIAAPRLYGPAGGFLFASLGVVSLVVSLVVASVNYPGRARDMFSAYRRAQRLSVEFERLKFEANPDPDKVRELSEQYQTLLDESENQEDIDYLRATSSMPSKSEQQLGTDESSAEQDELAEKRQEESKKGRRLEQRRRRWLAFLSGALTVLPYIALLVPIGVTVPIVLWVIHVSM